MWWQYGQEKLKGKAQLVTPPPPPTPFSEKKVMMKVEKLDHPLCNEQRIRRKIIYKNIINIIVNRKWTKTVTWKQNVTNTQNKSDELNIQLFSNKYCLKCTRKKMWPEFTHPAQLIALHSLVQTVTTKQIQYTNLAPDKNMAEHYVNTKHTNSRYFQLHLTKHWRNKSYCVWMS